MLETTDLECIRGHRRLFRDLSFSVRPGDCVQLTGPNGSGKTSLLRMLCGLMSPSRGEIRWQGVDIKDLGEEYNSTFTYLGHRPGVKDELTAIENLRVACGMSGVEIAMDHSTEIIERVGLKEWSTQPARLLSEGLRRRLALARLLACRTTLWLLDETLASLDAGAVEWTRRLIEDHLTDGGMVVIATHQELQICARIHRIRLAS